MIHFSNDIVWPSYGEIDLVEDGDDYQIILDGEIGVGNGLGLDALERVDQKNHAFAGG